MICIAIFALTLIAYIVNKTPMWVTAMVSMCALVGAGCLKGNVALSGFSNTNTILLGSIFIVGAGLQKTTFVETMCSTLMKLTRGSFNKVYFGFLIIGALISNFIPSPAVSFSIVAPLLVSLCRGTNHSVTKYMFPLMVVCVGSTSTLPFASAISNGGQFNGFLQTYGFEANFDILWFLIGKGPVVALLILWALFLGPRSCPEAPAVDVVNKEASANFSAKPGFRNSAGIVVFFGTILALIFSSVLKQPTWFISVVGSLLMVLVGPLSGKDAIKAIPTDMLLLYVGSLALGNSLAATGAGDVIGKWLSELVGGTHNNYVLGALFFIFPFFLTQFMLNKVVNQIFIPICLLTCKALGANPFGLMILAQAGAFTAIMTPMATPAVIMCMAEGGYDLKALFKCGWLICIALCVVYTAYVMTMFPAF